LTRHFQFAMDKTNGFSVNSSDANSVLMYFKNMK